ncbi:odorant receptor 4-like isoform X1 [Venturia canescens]|uniref:odorant receptor 4-like isoform X1 n=1 Tax=Venturia canescens TaxID=32260 RepID=UPI001C9D5FB3|nr:odorant receptor 4-like isoform X1 [Venturia canescens]
MDFRSINRYNVLTNAVSGNFLPLMGQKTKFHFPSTFWGTLVWIVEATYVTSWIIGNARYNPPAVAFQEASASWILAVELLILTIHLNIHRGDLRDLIRRLNDILVESDDFKRCLAENVDPNVTYLKMYSVMAFSSTVLWAVTPIFQVFSRDTFTYGDWTMTAYVPGEPFGVTTFACGVFFQVFGGCYLVLKKLSIDIYVSYFVTLLTSQYKYVREEIAKALHPEIETERDEQSVIDDLKKCVEHHCAVIGIARDFMKIVAVNVGLTYIGSILRFCFVSFAVVAFRGFYVYQFVFFLYGMGVFAQVFILCLAAQQLLDASTTVTADAFHENWHKSNKSVKKLFYTIELSNHIECKLTAYRTVDLIIPTLAVIMNKAYSVFLLLQEMN